MRKFISTRRCDHATRQSHILMTWRSTNHVYQSCVFNVEVILISRLRLTWSILREFSLNAHESSINEIQGNSIA